jgi:phospholipase C
MPVQEKGTRPARPVPYSLDVRGIANFAGGTFQIRFANHGKTAVYQVRSGNSSLGPWTYTVGEGAEITETWQITGNNLSGYDLSVNGPNGFLRAFKGGLHAGSSNLDVQSSSDSHNNQITLSIENRSAHSTTIRVTDAYSGGDHKRTLKSGESIEEHWPLHHSYGWYDLTVESESDATFRYQVAGHVETGSESRTDPAIATTA